MQERSKNQFCFTKEELRDLGELWSQCGLNTKRRVKEMTDLEERITRIEERLGGLEVIDGNCPKCGHPTPIIRIFDFFDQPNYIIRCLRCLQALKHIPGSYEIKD